MALNFSNWRGEMPKNWLLDAVQILLVTLIAFTSSAQLLPGRFDIIVKNAGISTMHAAVTRFGTVILLDRTNIGPSQINLTANACRDNAADRVLKHDCTAHAVYFNPSTNDLHPMFIYSDTWCSSGQFLGNGTLMQTGGYFEGWKKIRYMNPCGYEKWCDWTQSDTELQNGRWYATNQILPDGRVIIVGGLAAQTYEFVPSNGIPAAQLQLLVDTQEAPSANNYYPYVHLLPDGNLFIFANRDSVLFDYHSNKVLKKFPTIPGEPRNYPCAGSSVMLPLDSANNYSTAQVLVCGGSNKNAFANPALQLPASQTCGLMGVTSDSPSWQMLFMPLRRNMGDMIILPTGKILIINGAQNGSQGYGSASNACLNPLIFDASTLAFEMQAATTIPRVYHSTANLLQDGRILVAGSNTHEQYDFTQPFPTELRLETFSPAYLDAAYDLWRPHNVSFPLFLKYGEAFSLKFALPANMSGGIELRLNSSPFTTHSYSQGQRQIKLPVSPPLASLEEPYTFTVDSVVPSNAAVLPPNYYMLFCIHRGVPGTSIWVLISH